MKLLKLMSVLLTLSWLYGCGTTGSNISGISGQSDRTETDGMAIEDPNVIALDDDISDFDATTADITIDNGAETKVIVADREQYQSYEFTNLGELNNPASLLANRVVYFDYDSAVVKKEDQTTLETHATYLADNSNVVVRLIGHTDERGSREYNLALGERRALAVRQILMLQGASIDQLQVISMGEEHPHVRGSYEFAWQQNRRVELLYLGQ